MLSTTKKIFYATSSKKRNKFISEVFSLSGRKLSEFNAGRNLLPFDPEQIRKKYKARWPLISKMAFFGTLRSDGEALYYVNSFFAVVRKYTFSGKTQVTRNLAGKRKIKEILKLQKFNLKTLKQGKAAEKNFFKLRFIFWDAYVTEKRLYLLLRRGKEAQEDRVLILNKKDLKPEKILRFIRGKEEKILSFAVSDEADLTLFVPMWTEKGSAIAVYKRME